MDIAVIYEEEYVLYDQHHSRSIYAVMVQNTNEPSDVFTERVHAAIKSLESLYSYYDYEIPEIM